MAGRGFRMTTFPIMISCLIWVTLTFNVLARGQSIIEANTELQEEEPLADAAVTLKCHRRLYTYRVTQTDENGKQCWDTLSVMACWGRCDSNEMPRTRVRKTERGLNNISEYEQAYEQVLGGKSVRGAAKAFDLCHVSLMRYKRKREARAVANNEGVSVVSMGYNSHTRVFSENQEAEMVKYIIKAANIYYGLSPKEIRRLAFELATKYSLKIHTSWTANEIAGEDWFSGFMKRHPDLSIRCAQATSLSRATSFNRTNVKAFYDNVNKVMDRDKFTAKDIYNIDETGVTTVQKPNRIVAKRGTRQVGALTSGERGVLVTVTIAVNAIGNSIPPMFVFPRIRYQHHFIRDGPTGCVGAGNSSGWMQETEFVMFLKHFQNHTNSSEKRKVLLLLDNHSSHITIEALDFCKANGIVMLSFPPHCSHKLQPLDRSVFGPFKKAVNSACDAWMRNNPGKPMSIYDIPSIVATALPSAVTQTNIQAGFRCTGIYPFNKDIFTDIDFAPSYVTDREISTSAARGTPANQQQTTSQDSLSQPEIQAAAVPVPQNILAGNETPEIQTPPENSLSNLDVIDRIVMDTSNDLLVESQMTNLNMPSTSKETGTKKTATAFSPECVRPFPKAGPRKMTTRGKKKRKSAIYTDTPEKEAVRLETIERDRKKRANVAKRNITDTEGGEKKKNSSKKKHKDKSSESSEDEDEYFCLVCVEPYSTSKPGEKWVQCIECKFWSHEECTFQNDLYICHNCESE